MGSAGVTLPQHGHGEVAFSRVRRGVQDFILAVQNFTK